MTTKYKTNWKTAIDKKLQAAGKKGGGVIFISDSSIKNYTGANITAKQWKPNSRVQLMNYYKGTDIDVSRNSVSANAPATKTGFIITVPRGYKGKELTTTKAKAAPKIKGLSATTGKATSKSKVGSTTKGKAKAKSTTKGKAKSKSSKLVNNQPWYFNAAGYIYNYKYYKFDKTKLKDIGYNTNTKKWIENAATKLRERGFHVRKEGQVLHVAEEKKYLKNIKIKHNTQL